MGRVAPCFLPVHLALMWGAQTLFGQRVLGKQGSCHFHPMVLILGTLMPVGMGCLSPGVTSGWMYLSAV